RVALGGEDRLARAGDAGLMIGLLPPAWRPGGGSSLRKTCASGKRFSFVGRAGARPGLTLRRGVSGRPGRIREG
ncbi:MAG: hypothetical protein U1E53_33995, partial [Dongiaceae bacterium]